MSYDSPKWVSKYTYKGLYDEDFSRGKKSPGDSGKRLRFDYEKQEYLTLMGIMPENGELQNIEIVNYDLNVEEQDGSDCGYSILLLDNHANTISEQKFCPGNKVDGGGNTFIVKIPLLSGAANLVIKYNAQTIYSKGISNNRPKVRLLHPNGGNSIGDTCHIQWEYSDSDGDSLLFTILYSKDNGQNWQAIALDEQQSNYLWNATEYPGSNQAIIRVIVSDGVFSSFDDSDQSFGSVKRKPTAQIFTPEDNDMFYKHQMIPLEGFVYDVEDGPDPDSVCWISDLDGFLGSDDQILIDSLTPGNHIISLIVIDTDKNQAVDRVSIKVSELADSDNDGIADDLDNCRYTSNPGQEDTNQDATGDACDDCNSIPDPDFGNIIINGNFGDCVISPWDIYLVDPAVNTINPMLVGGELVLTGITPGADNLDWHIQLLQTFTQEQLNRLEEGATYELSFDVRAEAEGRDLYVFLGHNSDYWFPYIDERFVVGLEQKHFSFEFTLTSVSSAERVLFGLGKESTGVTLDNVKLIKKEAPVSIIIPDDHDNILIYPNPANDLLNIQGANGSTVSLMDMPGRVIYSKIIDADLETFDLQELPDGLYIVQITKENFTSRHKIILQKE